MIKKLFFFLVIIAWGVFGSTYVYSNFYRSETIHFSHVYSNVIYNGNHPIISKNYVAFSSQQDLRGFRVHSPCNVSSKFIEKQNTNLQIFEIQFEDTLCNNSLFYLKDEAGKILLNTQFSLQIQTYFQLFNTYTDLENTHLERMLGQLEKQAEKFSLYAKLQNLTQDVRFFRWYFSYHQIQYQQQIIKEILQARQEKYMIPVPGYELPNRATKLPNSPRPYRSSYTYGVHEGWDIDSKFWDTIVSIDDGIILRTVTWFQFRDLDNILKGGTLSHKDFLYNLDILRWNQVWLKTSKWDVVFYSHLDQVRTDIYEGRIIKKWDVLWTVGITGVPDRDYTDYHLHFELRENPYNFQTAGKKTFEDYMNLDWYFKGKSAKFIVENQYTLFEK